MNKIYIENIHFKIFKIEIEIFFFKLNKKNSKNIKFSKNNVNFLFLEKFIFF